MPKEGELEQLGQGGRTVLVDSAARAGFRADSYDDEANTVEAVLYSGAEVARRGFVMRVDVNGMDLSRARNASGKSSIPLALEHWPSVEFGTVVGEVINVRVEGDQLLGTLRLAGDAELEAIRSRVREGIFSSVSIGFHIKELERSTRDDGAEFVLVTEAELMEVSLVAVPADPGAVILSAADDPAQRRATIKAGSTLSRGHSMPKENEAPTAPKPAAAPAETGGTPAVTMGATDQAELEQFRAEKRQRDTAEAETRRVAAVRKVAADFKLGDADAERFVAEGLTVEAAREKAQAIFAARHAEAVPAAAATVAPSQDRTAFRRQAAIDGVLLTLGTIKKDEAAEGASEFAGLTPVDLARECLAAHGVSIRGLARGLVVEHAFSHASGDFPLLLGGLLDRSLAAAYQQYPTTYQQFAANVQVANFRNHKRIGVGQLPLPKRLAENGKIPAGTFGEKGEDLKANEHGLIIPISRAMILADDLGALVQLPQMLGLAAAELEEETVYRILLDNPVMVETGQALFSAQHGNIGAGAAASRVDQPSLSAARRAMRLQRGPGDPKKGDEVRRIRIEPRILLTGADLETEGAAVLTPVTPANVGDVNPLANGSLRQVVGTLIDGSPEPWFLLGDPSVTPAIEYATLIGQPAPRIETMPGWNTTGTELRLLHDFGAAPVEWRAAYKNNGAAAG